MNKTEAIYGSLILWDWLADNPGKEKKDCYLVTVSEWDEECACCEYAEDHFRDEDTGKLDVCSLCPMRGHWPHSGGKHSHCGRVYYQWVGCGGYFPNESMYDRSFFAAVIAEAMEEALCV